MNTSKIEDFKVNHPEHEFPWFRTIELSEVQTIYSRLCRLAGLSENADGLSLVRSLEHTGKVLVETDLVDFSQDIGSALNRYQVISRPTVYINWYRFDKIDELRVEDFLKWFPDLWYTAAEDPDIFDEGLGWMLSIRHYQAFILRRF